MKTIGIMGAMREEITPLLEYFGSHKITEHANNKFYEIEYRDTKIIIAYSKIGKVNASITASSLVQKFGCGSVLFSGVAGAVNPKLKIADLVVASKTCQHDADLTPFGHPAGFISEMTLFEEADKELLKIAHKVAKDRGIKIMEGIIATGDQFVANKERKEWIASEFNADALEMEGASVGVTCNALGVPFFILRSISDVSDMDASFSFDEFVVSSAKTSAGFMVAMVDEIIG